jgi:hypothetical protein
MKVAEFVESVNEAIARSGGSLLDLEIRVLDSQTADHHPIGEVVIDGDRRELLIFIQKPALSSFAETDSGQHEFEGTEYAPDDTDPERDRDNLRGP